MCAEELGDAVPEMPVIFNKFGSVTYKGSPEKPLNLGEILPKDKGDVHYEAEICIQLGVSFASDVCANSNFTQSNLIYY